MNLDMDYMFSGAWEVIGVKNGYEQCIDKRDRQGSYRKYTE